MTKNRTKNGEFCSKPGGCIGNLFLRFYQIPCRNHRLVGDLHIDHIGGGSCSAGRIIIHSHKLLAENRLSLTLVLQGESQYIRLRSSVGICCYVSSAGGCQKGLVFNVLAANGEQILS